MLFLAGNVFLQDADKGSSMQRAFFTESGGDAQSAEGIVFKTAQYGMVRPGINDKAGQDGIPKSVFSQSQKGKIILHGQCDGRHKIVLDKEARDIVIVSFCGHKHGVAAQHGIRDRLRNMDKRVIGR